MDVYREKHKATQANKMTGNMNEEEEGTQFCPGCGWCPEYPMAHIEKAYCCSELAKIYDIAEGEDGDITLTHKETGETYMIML